MEKEQEESEEKREDMAHEFDKFLAVQGVYNERLLNVLERMNEKTRPSPPR